tara:strand:+ start:837 stop:1151 length:315 start_codon:yes stop_codon:yes gene_type:complete
MDIISIDDLHERIEELGNDELVLDVRKPEEFGEGHIKGARNSSHEEVKTIAEELRSFKTIYVHCKMGGRAQKAAETLEAEGLDNIVCVGKGGMQRWVEQGWPVE